MKFVRCFIFIALFILPFLNQVKAQTLEEIENRISVEIRDTHIILVQLFQNEIEGLITRSANMTKMRVHDVERIIALSVIETYKSFEQIKIDVQNALSRIDVNALKFEQGIAWSEHPTNNNEKWTYWIFTDPYSQANIYFELTYKIDEKEVLFFSYPYNF